MKKSPYMIERENPMAIISVIFMVLCAAIRIYYFAVVGFSLTEFFVHIILPVSAAVIFIAVVLFGGREHTHLTVFPVILGVAFFIIKATTFDSIIHTVLCIILYITVLCLYSLTVLGVIPTKKLLYPLFSLPLIYHIFVEDMRLYVFAVPPVPFIHWLPEISVLCIMAALLCVSVAFKKKV